MRAWRSVWFRLRFWWYVKLFLWPFRPGFWARRWPKERIHQVMADHIRALQELPFMIDGENPPHWLCQHAIVCPFCESTLVAWRTSPGYPFDEIPFFREVVEVTYEPWMLDLAQEMEIFDE